MKENPKKLSEMTDKELRDYILDQRSEMRNLLDAAEAEERDLTEEEQTKFDEFKSNAERGEARQIANLRPLNIKESEPKKEERKIHDIFAENLRKNINSRGEAAIEVRANVPINSVDVADTIPVLFKDIIDVLTPALIVEKAGAKMLFNQQGTPTWPTVGDVEATWEGENVALVDKSLDFSKIVARPHRMGLAISISRRALNQSNLDLYNLVVNKIAKSFAALLNKTLVSFTQVTGQAPKGVFITPSEDAIELSENPTFKEIVSLETEVMNKNIELDADGHGAYIISTAMRGKLKTTPIDDASNARMILEDNTMNGYPVIVSNYMPNDSIGFGFFEYSVISQFGDLSLIYDPLTGAKENKVTFVGNTEVDITVLRPEAFVVGTIEP